MWLTGIYAYNQTFENRFFLSRKDGYNNMIQTLNQISGNYINTTFAHSSNSARSVGTERGSISISEGSTADYVPDGNQTGWSSSALANLNGMMAEDTLHTVDTDALQTAGMRATGFNYWLGSRYTYSHASFVRFEGRYVLTSGPVTANTSSTTYSSASVGSNSSSYRGSSGNSSKVSPQS
jgi:hypothetical protein